MQHLASMLGVSVVTECQNIAQVVLISGAHVVRSTQHDGLCMIQCRNTNLQSNHCNVRRRHTLKAKLCVYVCAKVCVPIACRAGPLGKET